MSRISDGAVRASLIALVSAAALCGTGCKELDGRNGVRAGNRLFREMQFADSAAAYEQALKQVQSPIIHYNLGLSYSKLYKPGYDQPILIGTSDDPICNVLPGLGPTEAQVCVKRPEAPDQSDRRRFNECESQRDCPSSFECKKTTLCSASSAHLADLAAQHMLQWIEAQPADDVLAAKLKVLRDEIRAKQEDHEKRLAAIPESETKLRQGEIQRIKGVLDELGMRVDELTLKDDMRKLVTQAWIDTDQFDKAITYWEGELKAKPNDPTIMNNIAGIHLKKQDWRKAIAWYHKVSEAETETSAKIAALQSIGNVAWSKLNSKTLTTEESVELADYGVGALQEASALDPKLGKLYGLMASIQNFKSLTQGASFAAVIERSHAQDLLKLQRVLNDEAKKQQQSAAPATGG